MAIVYIFIISFFLNFLWEVWHSQLYTTCLEMEIRKCIRLLTLQSLKDALWISVAFYTITVLMSVSSSFLGWFSKPFAPLIIFAFVLLIFSYVVELHAIKTSRWEYSSSMPIVLGVGVTPLIELAVTGTLALIIVFGIL